jgi:peptidoglycan/xylan/chitin deacetylase (PgdA/CDA1 family)
MRTKQRLRDCLIAGVARWSRSRPGKRVIALHDVADAGLLRDKMAWLKEAFEVVPLDVLLREPVGARSRVAVTFDDGYASWHEVAAPVLRDLGIPAVFFVCSGFVGLDGAAAEDFCTRNLQRRLRLRPLTRRALAELARDPLFEVGGHTRHHVDLGRAWGVERLRDEIDHDRALLEDWTGEPVRFFAYPFGGPRNVSWAATGHVARSGYASAFTFMPGFAREDAHPFLLPRDGLEETAPVGLWRAWLRGGYDRLYETKARWLGR